MQIEKPYIEWSSDEQWLLEVGDKQRLLNVYPDIPDYRDYTYTPALIRAHAIYEPHDYSKLLVLDQGAEGACTGFGLAATINYLKHAGSETALRHKDSVSPRMLYELARKNDEWPGVKYVGSSCRGAIKGWYSMGVCREEDYPYEVNNPGRVTIERAKEARKTRIGAYYRINHRLADFHAAINETGAIFVSASVHNGWSLTFTEPEEDLPVIDKLTVDFNRNPGHAFCIVGYNKDGFIVQNSWGKKWGRSGFATWRYDDWYENIRDAWVFRLSLSTPSIWQVSTRLKASQPNTAGDIKLSKPVRSEIAGHFVHIDDGKFHDYGPYSSNLEDVKQTATHLASTDKYKHLLFYAHGGLNSPEASARRIRGMKDVFKGNDVYPYHFMYDTGITEEIKDVIYKKLNKASERTGSMGDITDYAIEKLLRGMGRSIWREMKLGARMPFVDQFAGWQVAGEFLTQLQQDRPDIKIHMIGHSTGSILLAYLLESMEVQFPNLRVETVSLLAPAATTDLFYSHFKPLLETSQNLFGINAMTIYNLSDKLERKDNVGTAYRKSLLYLVSRSFEEALGGKKEEDTQKDKRGARILGMQRYSVPVDRRVGQLAEFLYSGTPKADGRTSSESHGGFDNDIETMNDILRRILNQENPKRLFNQQDLSY